MTSTQPGPYLARLSHLSEDGVPSCHIAWNCHIPIGLPLQRGEKNQEVAVSRIDSSRRVGPSGGRTIDAIKALQPRTLCEMNLLRLTEPAQSIEVGRQPSAISGEKTHYELSRRAWTLS